MFATAQTATSLTSAAGWMLVKTLPLPASHSLMILASAET